MTDRSFAEIAAQLQANLDLDLPPVALALVQEPPAGLSHSDAQVPSACTFWRRAEQGVFYASAEEHFNCPIGSMVMGFELPEPKTQELMDLVGQMCQINYITPEEIPYIPKFSTPAAGIVYGPLADFPLEPDVVVVWTTPVQAMLFQESVGAARWSDSPAGLIFGRPGCGALPTAAARGKVTMSLGCAGMRTFTEIPDDRCLVAIPGSALETLGEQLAQMRATNEQMKALYASQKARF